MEIRFVMKGAAELPLFPFAAVPFYNDLKPHQVHTHDLYAGTTVNLNLVFACSPKFIVYSSSSFSNRNQVNCSNNMII